MSALNCDAATRLVVLLPPVEVGSGEGRGLEEGRGRMEMRNPIPRRSERRGIGFPRQKAGFSFDACARVARFTFQADWSGNEFYQHEHNNQ